MSYKSQLNALILDNIVAPMFVVASVVGVGALALAPTSTAVQLVPAAIVQTAPTEAGAQQAFTANICIAPEHDAELAG